jgi:response regulator RpfG family c-di-GMP phosphodiesterase
MFSGRVLIVSPRREVVAVIEPLVRAQGHIPLAVETAGEALETLQQGLIPDVVVSDGPSLRPEMAEYLTVFQDSNRVGRHLALMDETGPAAARMQTARRTTVLRSPVVPDELSREIGDAMEAIRRDLQGLRGELFRETARLQQVLRDTQREVVEALALAIESRDPYMRGHCTRVAAYAGMVAQGMGLPDDQIERLCTAARLHEIGRLSVPMELAHKMEPLTADELSQVRAHTLTGAGIIRSISSLRDSAVLVEGHAMPFADLSSVISTSSPDFLLAGILRVVDAFDAMTSPRAYRSPLPASYWRSVFERGSGTYFDPRAVKSFLHAPPQSAAA